MEIIARFVSEHINDDTSKLILNKSKWPDIDMDMVVNCIESRRKLKGKVPEWHENPLLVFPAKLSAEQCSSSATGRYKATFAESIASVSRGDEGWNIADLTGGLGVDSWFFAQKARFVLYNEMQEKLCTAAAHNFKELGAGNILISNNCAEEGKIAQILKDFTPDIVYMDPARRGEGGKKVFLIEECTPDVLKLKDEIFTHSRNFLLKLSPMADITMVCDRLGKQCREVHIVASCGECKELLIWMDREWNDDYTIRPVEIVEDRSASAFTFRMSEEKSASMVLHGTCLPIGTEDKEGLAYLFEPGKALMKSGAFNLICSRFGISKLGTSTHYYITEDKALAGELCSYGKVYRIKLVYNLDKRGIKAAAAAFPKSDVTARNIPMDTDTLRKKLGVLSGEHAHIFGLKSDVYGNLLLCTERVFEQNL